MRSALFFLGVKIEKKIWAGREEKIDGFARKGNFSVGIIDRKKIEKEYQKRFKKLTATEEPKTFREPKK